MDWVEIVVKVPSDSAEAVMAVMGGYCYGGVVAEPALLHVIGSEEPVFATSQDDTLKGYVALDGSAEQARLLLRESIYAVCHPTTYEERTIREADWSGVWKRHSRIQRVGTRLVICPSWKKHLARPGDIVITIDPGMAFGTGDHWTTRSCLRALETHLPTRADRVVDIGAGSGILAIAAAKLGAAVVLASDTDPFAVQAATENCARNNVADVVQVRAGSIEQIESHGWAKGTIDLLVANLNSALHLQLGEEMLACVMPGGVMIASGIGAPAAPSVKAHYRGLGAALIASRNNGEWHTLVLRKTL